MRKRHQKPQAMPQRPRQHELDTEAIEFIRSKLPNRWTREEIKHDYGKDLFVEIFEAGEATGLEFRIQSKGHEHFTISHKDQVIQPLEVTKLNYYEKLPLPILLVAYSAQKKQAYYLWIKPYILQVLDNQQPGWRELDGKSKISIRIPISNIYDDASFEDILNHVETEISKIRLLCGGDFHYTYRQKPIYKGFAASTRLIRPKVTRYLHRSELTAAISDALVQSSLFIQADAGYGKTWLLLDFINSTNPSVSIWYTFTKDPLDASRFIEELASELSRQTSQVGSETLWLVQNRGKETRPDEALAVLLTEVASAPNTPILLVLEDLHNANNDVYSAIDALLISCPKNLQIILTSRLPLPTNQAKLIAQGQLTIFERSKLEFSLDETSDYLKSVADLDLSTDQVKLLHERTGGWIAAVGLAIELLHNSSDQSNELFNRLTGFDGNIYNFFAEEVYKELSPETKFVLKRLGIARSIEPEVVNLFTGRTDGGQVLKDLSKHNTFLIENQEKVGHYQLHNLFSEFLLARFRDEDGLDTVRQAHGILATFYASHREWYLAAEQAIDAEEWLLAVQSLEIIGPIGVSLGYGQAFLEWSEKIPKESRNSSALFCELVGLSALQVGNLVTASQEFGQAKTLYILQQDLGALNRLEYYIAEVDLDRGIITPEDFLRIAHRVSSWSYQHNEVLFGTQVELRLIQVGQTITLKYGNLLPQLAERSEALIAKIDILGSEYEVIKAKVLASQAHLIFQVVTLTFQQEARKIQLREKLGHPVGMDERVSQAKKVMEGLHLVWGLYNDAERIVKEKSEIEWAIIRTSHLRDFAHHLSQVFLMGVVRASDASSQEIELEENTKKQLIGILVEIDGCVQIFGKYHHMYALTQSLCDAADTYDILGDITNRDRLAKEAHEIASERNFVDLKKRAHDLLLNQNTFTSLWEKASAGMGDRELANLDEKGKADYVNLILRAFAGNVEIDKIRNAIVSDIDDMVASAKQRLEWCRHVEVIQDLRHTRSLETMYREIPQKRIICMELDYQSPTPGLSFDKLWPMFKGVYCLGCGSRSLEK